MHVYYKFGLYLIFIFSISIYRNGADPTSGHQASLYDNDYNDNYDDYYMENEAGETGEGGEEQHLGPTQAQILTEGVKTKVKPLITSTTTTMRSIFSLFNLPQRSNHVKDPICPAQCFCLEDFRVVNCAHAQLKRIPSDIPATAHNLDLSFNQIVEIKKGDLANHSRLVEINLNHNQIKRLNKEVFHGLTKLQRLKLSANLLTVLEPDTFEEAKDLMFLDLSNNPIQLRNDGSFLNQPSLVELNCRNCSWSQLYDDTFANISALQVLRIDQNDFKQKINTQAFAPLKYLIKLRLPDLEQSNIEQLCALLKSIDNIGFKHFDVSCYELVLGTSYNDSIILATEPPPPSTNNKAKAETKIGAELPVQSTTIKIPTTTEQLIKKVDAKVPNTSKKETKDNQITISKHTMTTSQPENSSQELEIDGIFLSTESIAVVANNSSSTDNNSAKAYQVPVSAETIDRMLIGLMIISIIGLIIGLICRNDVGGIKTKCCRSRKSPEEQVEANETPAEEIPLNKIT